MQSVRLWPALHKTRRLHAPHAASVVCETEVGLVIRDGLGAGVMVGGRAVEVDVALSQDDARSLASGKAATTGSKDNRNLYLVSFLLSAYICQLTVLGGW